jgi:hypothetical protein
MKKWDPEEFVVQMLKTPGGLIFIEGKSSAFLFMLLLIRERVDLISQQHSHPYACIKT